MRSSMEVGVGEGRRNAHETSFASVARMMLMNSIYFLPGLVGRTYLLTN